MTASPWDRLPHPNPLGYVPRDNRTPYRIEAFENAIVQGGGSVELGAELRARRQYWLSVIETPSKLGRVLSFFAGRRLGGPTGATVLWLCIWTFATAAVIVAQISRLTVVVLTIAFVLPFVLGAWWKASRHAGLLDAIRDGTCPACGYELEGSDVMLPQKIAGEHCGPRRCPECGTPWPLVPPPCPT